MGFQIVVSRSAGFSDWLKGPERHLESSIGNLLSVSQKTLSQQLFDTFLESYLLQKSQKDMILRVSNRNRIKNQIQTFSKSFWWHITLNWSEIKPFFFIFYWKIFEAQSSGLWTDSERKNVQRRPMLVIFYFCLMA